MRGGFGSRGYTIIEVMIFLAISGFMFVIAAGFISGKQAKAEFRQGMNDINTQVQQAINDVSNGFYPSNSNFVCAANASGLTISNGASNTQGSNQGCVFLGKAIQLGVHGSGGTKYGTYTIAGSQFANGATSGTPPANFSEALPKTVDSSSVGVSGINLTQFSTLQWGLSATKMLDGATPISAVVFMGSFAGQSGGSLESGSQTVTVLVIPSGATDPNVSSGGASEAQMTAALNSGMTGANQRDHPNILMCFDGGKGQYGSLTIGGSGSSQRLTTSIRTSDSPASLGC